MTRAPETAAAGETPVKSDAELARALRLHRSSVCHLKRRGMPTHSVEAALAWRQRTLRPALAKDCNPARAAGFSEMKNRAATKAEQAQLDRLGRLMALAEAALRLGEFELVRPHLQRTLREIPPYLRSRVPQYPRAIDALAAWARERLDVAYAQQWPPVSQRLFTADKIDRQFWYAFIADEPLPVPQYLVRDLW